MKTGPLAAWFGIGETSKVVLILVGVVPTITIATLTSIHRLIGWLPSVADRKVPSELG